ncbi:unnamed protein product [Linum tenue]|uniref:Uncharacterized protein n=1 Tax=Linum tenue TaxID=586396 RepID=A0AAV0QT79_9ROSI|nr:unnamed protein product [Linum tenue]
MRAMRDEEQPVPVQGGGADGGVCGVRGGGGGGVAAGGIRLHIPAPERQADHGPSGHRSLPVRHKCHPHLIISSGTHYSCTKFDLCCVLSPLLFCLINNILYNYCSSETVMFFGWEE